VVLDLEIEVQRAQGAPPYLLQTALEMSELARVVYLAHRLDGDQPLDEEYEHDLFDQIPIEMSEGIHEMGR